MIGFNPCSADSHVLTLPSISNVSNFASTNGWDTVANVQSLKFEIQSNTSIDENNGAASTVVDYNSHCLASLAVQDKLLWPADYPIREVSLLKLSLIGLSRPACIDFPGHFCIYCVAYDVS